MKKNFSKDLLQKIKKDDVKQIPKYIFVLKNIFVWLFLFVSIILWWLSLSISFDYLINADWYLLKKVWFFKLLIVFLPLFWVLFLIISSFFSYYNYRHTNKGYKLSLIKVFLFNILLSIVFAIFLYFSWVNNFVESKLEKYIPKYRTLLVEDKYLRMIEIWQNENKWLLIWQILELWNNTLSFIDYNDKVWEIIINNNGETNIKHRVELKIWEKIKIIWEKIENNIFNALEIRPFIWRWNIR